MFFFGASDGFAVWRAEAGGFQPFATRRIAAWLDRYSLGQLDRLLGGIRFVDYWIHRGQHHFEWWWKLHALHHSQRQMTMWTDNRNHLLDDVLRDVIWVVVAQCIGVAPAQFIAIVAIAQLSESFQHANLRVWFGVIGERFWVSPRFHRLHHSIGIGHETVKDARRGADGQVVPAKHVVLSTAPPAL